MDRIPVNKESANMMTISVNEYETLKKQNADLLELAKDFVSGDLHDNKILMKAKELIAACEEK